MKPKLIFISLSLFFAFSPSSAQVKDNTFGTNGKVYTKADTYNAISNAMAIQPDGKIVMAGNEYYGSYMDLTLITRYLPNGKLDTSFATTGKLLSTGFIAQDCNTILIQNDGKVVVGGRSNGEFSMVRLLTNGDLDTSFNITGKVTFSFGASASGASIKKLLQQPDGKIIAVGDVYIGAEFENMAAVRFNINGSVDMSFGSNGATTVDFLAFQDICADAILQSDGKIVMVGNAQNTASKYFHAMARLNTNGTLDNTFGSSGKVTRAITTNANFSEAVTIQSDNKILIGGSSDGDFVVLRYNTNGTPDATFGITGYTITDFNSGSDNAFAILLLPNNKILLAGTSVIPSNGVYGHFAIARYNSNGTLDNTFATNGKMVEVMLSNKGSKITDMAMQADGKIVLSGEATDDTTTFNYSQFALLRITNVNTTGISISQKSNIRVFPIPALSKINIDIPADFGEYSLTITNTLGQIMSAQQKLNSIDISSFNTGMYLLKIENEIESIIYKIIKQ